MLIGKQAPDFRAQAFIEGQIKTVSLEDYKDKYKIMFFYPLDFTFICPTEIMAFQELLEEFKKRQAVVLGISVDSVYSHRAWSQVSRDKGGIMGVTYPLLSDITKKISCQYDVLDQESGLALRGLFIIDKNNIVQVMQVNNEQFGRNTHEVLRLLDAVIFYQKHGEVCPVNWQEGQKGLVPTLQGLEQYLKNKKN
jgi:peroxiredoxin 2/4